MRASRRLAERGSARTTRAICGTAVLGEAAPRVRPRGDRGGRAMGARRVLPPEPAEHLHGDADRRDARPGRREGPRSQPEALTPERTCAPGNGSRINSVSTLAMRVLALLGMGVPGREPHTEAPAP